MEELDHIGRNYDYLGNAVDLDESDLELKENEKNI